jgi:hypothetical protein
MTNRKKSQVCPMLLCMLLFEDFQADENVFQVVFRFAYTGRIPVHTKAPCHPLQKCHTHLGTVLKTFVTQRGSVAGAREGTSKQHTYTLLRCLAIL